METRIFKHDEKTRVWVRGNAAHPEKVVEVLEQRGARRMYDYNYADQSLVFYIDNDGYIEYVDTVSLQFEWLKYAWGEILIGD